MSEFHPERVYGDGRRRRATRRRHGVEVSLRRRREPRIQRLEDLRRPRARPRQRREVLGQLGVELGEPAEQVHQPRADEERLAVSHRRRAHAQIALEPRAERVVALREATQVPRPCNHRRQPKTRAGTDARDEDRREPGHIELAEQIHDLGRVIVGRQPDAVLHRPEPEEPKPPPQPRPLEPAVLGDLMPEHGPRADVRGQTAEREDPPVALDQQPLAPRRQPVVHEPPGPHPRDQLAPHEPGQGGAGGAVREPELAQQHHQPATPYGLPERAHVRPEQRDHQVLRLERLPVRHRAEHPNRPSAA